MKINQVNIPLQQTENKIKDQQMADSKGLMEACRQFEAIFLNMMLKQMRSTVQDGGLTEKTMARDIFESMYDEKLSVEMSKGQGIGLAKELYQQLSRRYPASRLKQISNENTMISQE